jgi:hypothetical protein
MSDEKIKIFEDRLIAERDKLRKGFTVAVTAYAVIALAVIVYAVVVFNGFRTIVGPKGLSEQCMSYINMTAHAPQQLKTAYDDSKDEWAQLVVTKALDAIPEVEQLIKTQLDGYNADIKEAIVREIMPNFKEYMKGAIPELKVRLGELKKTRPDATVGMALTAVFVEYLERETARLLKEDEVVEQAGKLQKDLYALQKPTERMTRKELATRKLLISFILISKLDTDGSPMLEEFQKFLEKRFGVTAGQVQEDKVLEDVQTEDTLDEL